MHGIEEREPRGSVRKLFHGRDVIAPSCPPAMFSDIKLSQGRLGTLPQWFVIARADQAFVCLSGLGNGEAKMGFSQHHRGIGFAVERLSERQWRWEISPPACVLGLCDQRGDIIGDVVDAIRAARAAIETQTGQHSH